MFILSDFISVVFHYFFFVLSSFLSSSLFSIFFFLFLFLFSLLICVFFFSFLPVDLERLEDKFLELIVVEWAVSVRGQRRPRAAPERRISFETASNESADFLLLRES